MKTNKKPAPTEESMIKALNRLEKAAAIPKEMRDADGGFATEGDHNELQVSAEEDAEPHQGKVKKAKDESSSEESVEKAEDDMSGEESSAESSSEESSDEESAPPAKMKMAYSKKKGKGGHKVNKGGKGKGNAEETSGEEHSSAETSSPEMTGDGDEESLGESPKPAKMKARKSIKKSLIADESNRELVEASAFVESLVDATSSAMSDLSKSVSESHQNQTSFNKQLAKGMIAMGNLVIEQRTEMRKLRKALERLPATQGPHGKTVLNKSDVQEREFTDVNVPPEGAALDRDSFQKSLDSLVSLAAKGTIKPELVTDFELAKSLEVLPPEVRQMIAGDLH